MLTRPQPVPLPPRLARRKRGHPEADFQKLAAEHLALVLPPSVYWTAIGHGVHLKDKRLAGILKAMGVKAGVPDMLVIWAHVVGHPHIAWLELKSKTGTLTPEQREFRATMAGFGAHFAMVRTLEAIEATLRGWGCPLRGRITA